MLFTEEVWTKVDTGAIDLLKQMLELDSRKRVSSEEAVQHYWIQQAKRRYLKELIPTSKIFKALDKLQNFRVGSQKEEEESRNLLQRGIMLYLAAHHLQ